MTLRQMPEIHEFASSTQWERWLSKNHARSQGIWLRLFKKASGVRSVSYDDALKGAICYGWIDGQLKPYDEKSWLRKFTPRRAYSLWSKRNIEHVQRLLKAGKMKPAGIREVQAARADGRWKNAYDPSSTMALPDDFLKRLTRSKKAREFFHTLDRSNIYAIAWRLQTAATRETREKRMEAILAMLMKGKKFHD